MSVWSCRIGSAGDDREANRHGRAIAYPILSCCRPSHAAATKPPCGAAVGPIILSARYSIVPVDDAGGEKQGVNAMDETIAVSSTMDYSAIYDAVSDEELEAAAEGLQASWGTFGGWMSSTQACCSPHDV